MILVTGATGFVGGGLVRTLASQGVANEIVISVRSKNNKIWPTNIRPVVVADLLPDTDWSEALKGVRAVVHCAARVHVMNDKALDPLDAYRLVNVQGTLSLARQAAVAGVRRFVFVSSIKVNGEKTELGHPFVADDMPAPMDPYGVSKFEAEQALMLLGKQTGMEIVIVRPPLVYGPGVKANFQTMLRWVALGIPLPLGGIKNARSMVALGNLVDLLILCIDHPEAAGQIFLVSDGEDVSTSELLRRSAQAMQKTIYLPSVPDGLIYFFADIFGRRAMAERLCGSLQVDIQKTRDLLNWQPPLTLRRALELTVENSSL